MITESSGKPILDLTIPAQRPGFIAALPAGEAIIVYNDSVVVKVNNQGQIIQTLHDCDKCNSISGVLSLGANVYVVYDYGAMVQIQLSTRKQLKNFSSSKKVNIGQSGCLWFDPSSIPDTDILLLPDLSAGRIIVTSEKRELLLDGLNFPTSVSYMFMAQSTFYVVCEMGYSRVNVYSSTWEKQSSIQGDVQEDYMDEPTAAIVSPNNSIIVSDKDHDHISAYTKEGDFISHLLTEADGINQPKALSYFENHLWVIHTEGVYRYRVDEW